MNPPAAETRVRFAKCLNQNGLKGFVEAVQLKIGSLRNPPENSGKNLRYQRHLRMKFSCAFECFVGENDFYFVGNRHFFNACCPVVVRKTVRPHSPPPPRPPALLAVGLTSAGQLPLPGLGRPFFVGFWRVRIRKKACGNWGLGLNF